MVTRAGKTPKQSRSRARVDKPDMGVTQQRVGEIRRSMANLRWNAEERARLASEWGLSDNRVGQLAGEASRSLRCDETEVAELKDTLAGALEEFVRHALNDRSNVTGQLDIQGGIKAILELGRWRGVAPAPEATATAPVVIHISSNVARAYAPADVVIDSPSEPPKLAESTH